MTTPRRERQQNPHVSRAAEKTTAEISEPYDPPDLEDQRSAGRPAYLIVVDQLRGWQPAQSPSLAELLESGRTRQLEPGLEAEP